MEKPSGELLSSAVVESLREHIPHLQTSNWRKQTIRALKWAARRGGFPREFAEIVTRFPFNPDAFVVNRAERFLHFFEIEVYNPMRHSKLLAYARLQWQLDYDEIAFAVLIVNRYGHLIEVDLDPYHAHILREQNAGTPLPPMAPAIVYHAAVQ